MSRWQPYKIATPAHCSAPVVCCAERGGIQLSDLPQAVRPHLGDQVGYARALCVPTAMVAARCWTLQKSDPVISRPHMLPADACAAASCPPAPCSAKCYNGAGASPLATFKSSAPNSPHTTPECGR